MSLKRSAGILLHPTSLPGRYGIGDLGKEAYSFIDFLESAGQNIWQVFPLGPTGYGDSPYQCFSAFAGNPLLISPDLLIQDGLLEKNIQIPKFDSAKIDFGPLINFKFELLNQAYEKFKEQNYSLEDYCGYFCDENKDWLDDYALFMAAKEYHGGVEWTKWSEDIAFRKDNAVELWTIKLEDRVNFHKFIQSVFFKQWSSLRTYANNKGIEIIGDLPIFIAYDSADCWSEKGLFSVNETGRLEFVAGVPPDYFSETGQLWGNPLYRWDVMERNNFRWWKKRFTNLLKLVDIIRIDHFRGFESYWEIPGGAPNAINGRWIKAPGEKLFSEIRKELGDLPIIAEDLGVITKEVADLRNKFNFPGIRILQFAFGASGDKRFLPHNFDKNCVVHTGSHDNETTKGFFENEKKNKTSVYKHAKKYLQADDKSFTFAAIKSAYASCANIVVIPLQDILELGNEARMNFPGKLGGNWCWRFTKDQLNKSIAKVYKEMAELYERTNISKGDY